MQLNVTDLYASYTANNPILKGVSMTAKPGQVTIIVGPNGCGKSTFLNLLNGSLSPLVGEVDQSNGSLRVGRYSQHFVDDLPGNVSAVEYLHALVGESVQRGSSRYQEVRTELGTKGLPSVQHELELHALDVEVHETLVQHL